MNRIKVYLYRLFINLLVKRAWRGKVPRLDNISNVSIPVEGGSIRARIYRPEGEGPLPAIAYFHGGGFVLGGLASHDALCRDLCLRSGHMVVAVDYRLAPEYPFPVAAEDCIASLAWMAANASELGIDAQALYVAGDSAGGNLAAIVALEAKADNEKCPVSLRGQVLIYPVIEHYSADTHSYRENATGQGLTRDAMVWFWDTYYQNSPLLQPGQLEHPLVTPLCRDDLAGQPPALVITAEKDPLRDEGNHYALRLQDEGVDVQHTQYEGQLHGFIGIAGPQDSHQQGVAEIAAWLERTNQQYA